MKKIRTKIRIILGVTISLALSIIGAVIGLSVWANKPRGIRIDLDSIKD